MRELYALQKQNGYDDNKENYVILHKNELVSNANPWKNWVR
jgi:hypothetical protein